MRLIDLRCLELLIDSAPDSPLKRDRLKRTLRKRYARGELSRANEDLMQRWRMCEARFVLGDFTDFGGWELRDKWAAGMWHRSPYKLPMWDGKSAGRVYVIGEQGLGDEVFFNAFLPADCVVECDERLIPALNRAGVECVPSVFAEGRTHRWRREIPAGCDYWFPAGDLLRYCKPRVPYLTADPLQVERFQAYRGRVGICWRGRTGSYKLVDFQRVAERPVSLQYDLEWDEVAEEVAGLDVRNDIEGVLGLLANLDRVVTVSSTVAHLAICSGVKTDVVLAPQMGQFNKFPWKYGVYGVKTWPSLKAYLGRS